MIIFYIVIIWFDIVISFIVYVVRIIIDVIVKFWFIFCGVDFCFLVVNFVVVCVIVYGIKVIIKFDRIV